MSSGLPRWVRSFLFTQLLAIRFYRKGKHVIDPLLPPDVVAALAVIDAAYAALGLINPPGPR